MESIARHQFAVALIAVALTLIGVTLPTLYRVLKEYFKERREEAETRVRQALATHGRMTHGELMLESKLSEKRLNRAVASLAGNSVVRTWSDPQTARKMIELWHYGAKEGRFKNRFS